MRYGSVCSGIESASVAWHVFGWQPAWLSETDKAASRLLAKRFPDVTNLGDMLALPARVRSGEIEAPDMLVGGTPCQAFSVAGMRRGMADARGQLTMTYVELADAIDEKRGEGNECISVWENVPGVLNHKENPFGCFLGALAGEDVPLEPPGGRWTNAGCVFGPKRTIAWRVIDAQYFGLAQRRRRVFVVASARDDFDPVAVFLECEGVRRDTPPSREAGQGLTHPVAPCLTSSGRGVERTGDPRGQDAVVACDPGHVVLPGVQGDERSGVVSDVRVVRAYGADERVSHPVKWPAELAPTLNAHFGDKQGLEDQHVNQNCPMFVPAPICFSSKDYGGDAITEMSPTLRSGNHSESHANAGVPPAVAYSIARDALDRTGEAADGTAANRSGLGIDVDVAATLKGKGPGAVCVTGSAPCVTVTLRGREGGATAELGSDIAGVLRASNGGGDKPHVLQHMAVRRLMPVECERLQGFPDGWTEGQADGPRYKQLGNSKAVPCIRWVGMRIQRQLGFKGTLIRLVDSL